MCAYGVVWLNEWIVDGNNLNVVELDGIAEDNAANATEAVDSDLSWCHFAGEVVSFCVWMCFEEDRLLLCLDAVFSGTPADGEIDVTAQSGVLSHDSCLSSSDIAADARRAQRSVRNFFLGRVYSQCS